MVRQVSRSWAIPFKRNKAKFYITFLFVVIIVLPNSSCIAQSSYRFKPRELYSKSSHELITFLRQQLQDELNPLGRVRNKALVEKIFSERINFIVSSVKQGAFIEDDTLENFAQAILDRLVQKSELKSYPRKVLILNSPEVNAFCFGKGLFVVSVSLLSRILNESQLAFALGHELAHDELHHITEGVVKEAEINLQKKTNQQISKIIKGEITVEDIESFREIIYGVRKFSRAKELAADSLGFLFLTRASYNPDEAAHLINILDSAQYPKRDIKEALFLPLHFTKYPFQEYWLNERLSIYSKEPDNVLFYAVNSLKSHPEIRIRINHINRYRNEMGPVLGGLPTTEIDLSDNLVSSVVRLADFQTIEAAYKTAQFDYCLFHALQLWSDYPNNVYIVSTISKVLIDLFEARNNDVQNYGVSKFTDHYSESLRLINNLLHNISVKELSEVAYHFINNQSNFNENEEEHYVLLAKICEITYRYEVKSKISKAFKARFNKTLPEYQRVD
jgi:Zn-dependent protease with chaperone function